MDQQHTLGASPLRPMRDCTCRSVVDGSATTLSTRWPAVAPWRAHNNVPFRHVGEPSHLSVAVGPVNHLSAPPTDPFPQAPTAAITAASRGRDQLQQAVHVAREVLRPPVTCHEIIHTTAGVTSAPTAAHGAGPCASRRGHKPPFRVPPTTARAGCIGGVVELRVWASTNLAQGPRAAAPARGAQSPQLAH